MCESSCEVVMGLMITKFVFSVIILRIVSRRGIRLRVSWLRWLRVKLKRDGF